MAWKKLLFRQSTIRKHKGSKQFPFHTFWCCRDRCLFQLVPWHVCIVTNNYPCGNYPIPFTIGKFAFTKWWRRVVSRASMKLCFGLAINFSLICWVVFLKSPSWLHLSSPNCYKVQSWPINLKSKPNNSKWTFPNPPSYY